MEIVFKNIKDLKPYKNNPRNNEDAVQYVMNSINEFGFKVPLVISKTGEVIAGHTRLLASERMGLEKVPCIIANDLNDEQIKAFRLVDNKVSEISSWDWIKLEKELDEIELDMTAFSFQNDDFDIDDFFNEKSEEKEKKKRTIICEHCGHEIEL